MPPTGGPTGMPGCCECATQSTCGPATIPQVSLTLDFLYRTFYVTDGIVNGTPFRHYDCVDLRLTVPLTYQPAGGGSVEKWVSGISFIEFFPSYQYYLRNTENSPNTPYTV